MLSDWNGTLFGIIMDSSLRVALVAAIVALILLLVRVRSSAVRHAAWTAVLCAMLLMPILPYCVPSITIPVPMPSVSIDATTVIPEGGPPAPVAESQAVLSPALDVASPPAVGLGAPSDRKPIWPAVILVAYGMGLVLLASRLFMGWRSMVRLTTTSRRIVLDAEMQPTPLSHCIPVRESERVAAPVTVGVLSASIILPIGWRLWPEEKLRAVLAHELAHIQRRDPLVSLLAYANHCIFWFHPLAWWLERKLAATAEHACDDAAVRAIGKARQYAEVLLDMAVAVRRSGGRLALQGVGIDGSGLLSQRIDRILRGDFFKEMSAMRKIMVALGCAAAIFLVVACRQQLAPPAPLQEDPKRAEELAQQKARSDFYQAATEMTPQQVAELEVTVKNNPEDLVSLEKLLMFYAPISKEVKGEKGRWAPICAQVIGEKECIAARRPHILWLIDHHPEHKMAGEWGVRIFPTSLDPLPDLSGYAAAKKLWLEKTSQPDASVAVLKNASYFLETADKPLTEKLLLRLQALDPKGGYSYSLGRLYAFVLVGANSSMPLNVVRTVSAADAKSSYAQEIRKKLAESTDADLLGTAATYLASSRQLHLEDKIGFDPGALANSYQERALQLNPQSTQARYAVRQYRAMSQGMRMAEMLRNVPKESQYQTVTALPETERFGFLPQLAMGSYEEGNSLDYYKHDTTGAKAAWERARKYAQDALQLAPKFRDNQDYGKAVYMGNIVLGLVTLRDGDKPGAVRYMLAASHAPASEDFDYYMMFHQKLTSYLLKYGARESVIEFLERIAPLANASQKAYMLDSADKIRKGIQPLWYPRDETNREAGKGAPPRAPKSN